MFEPDGPKRLCDVVTGDETWLPFHDIPSKRSNQMWVAADGKRPVVLRPGLQSRTHCFPPPPSPPPNAQGLVIVDILAQKSTLTTTYCVETVLPKVIKSVRRQRQTVGTGKTLLIHQNVSDHTVKVTVTFLKE